MPHEKQKPWWEVRAPDFFFRSWRDISDWWIATPYATTVPGSRPTSELSDLPTFTQAISPIQAKTAIDFAQPIEGVRSAILGEAIYLFHKAANVVGSSLQGIDAGFSTWSIPNAYQAAFFAAKALMGLFGVAVTTHESRSFLVDGWSMDPDAKPRIKRLGPQTRVIMVTNRIEHQPIWYLFQRMIRVTELPEEILSKELIASIGSIPLARFPMRRNQLQYQSLSWLLADIRDRSPVPDFCQFAEESVYTSDFVEDTDRVDWIIGVCGIFLATGVRLLRDLGSRSVNIRKEYDALRNWLDDDAFSRHRAVLSFDN